MCRSNCILPLFIATSKLVYSEFGVWEYVHNVFQALSKDSSRVQGKFLWDLWLWHIVTARTCTCSILS